MLTQIVRDKYTEVQVKMRRRPLTELMALLSEVAPTRDFKAAIQRKGKKIQFIAELKKASPSRGLICPSFNPVTLAEAYVRGGAAALSVLTDQKYFQGDLGYLAQVRQVCSPPLLRKDFIIHPYQLFESRVSGADAVLLIAAVLSSSSLEACLSQAASLGLACLVEVHHAAELEKALQAGARLIGINNRDLNTFQVELNTTRRLRPLVPQECLVVSESGIRSREDVTYLADCGVDAVLVGEAVAGAVSAEEKIKRLLGNEEGSV